MGILGDVFRADFADESKVFRADVTDALKVVRADVADGLKVFRADVTDASMVLHKFRRFWGRIDKKMLTSFVS